MARLVSTLGSMARPDMLSSSCYDRIASRMSIAQIRSRDVMDEGPAPPFSPRLRLFVLGSLLALVAAGVGLALVLGPYRMSWTEVIRTLLGRADTGRGLHVARLQSTVIWDIRLPRIVLSLTVGAALAGAGAVFQGAFRNPLVDPYILGASSGAAFGAALGILAPSFPLSVQVAAFVSASSAVASVYALARIRGETPLVTLVLAGVIVGSVFAAGVSMLTYLASDVSMRQIVFWLMGGFYFASWRDVTIAGPAVLVGLAGMWAFGWTLNVLSMGDQEARTLGVDPERARRILITLATLVTAVSVASVGVVAWVGLMMPHAARLLVGPDNRYAIPASALLGGVYLLVCDTLARTLLSSEIPVGIVTSIAGAPYLVYLLRSRTRGVLG
jgi:iron complex transport system permease protein